MKKILLLVVLSFTLISQAQEKGTVVGHILSEGQAVPFASILLKNATTGTSSDENGNYSIEVPSGKQTIIVQAIGFKNQEKNINVPSGGKIHLDFNLEESVFGLNQVVVSATRGLQKRTEAPVIVTVTNSEVLQKAQAISLSEGLSFQPGLRMETNCQNCGFSQVRMNGLDGAYSQILMDSRPIFSALNGVYGLDQIPTNMIERIEVVRGGGSSLYGSNAIAGTINIITKDPIENSFEINSHLGLIDGNVPDKALTLNGTVLSEDLNLGIQIFAMLRDREPFDANDDNFTEITTMQNRTFGFKSFYRPFERSKITAEFHTVNEFRRGGENRFDLQPFEALTTEQITSKMVGGGLTFENYSEDEKNKYAVYFNTQQSKNDNFYGGRADDEFGNIDYEESIRGYGNTEVVTWIGGAQYNRKQESFLGGSATLTTGAEYKKEMMVDEKPGYNAFVNQTLDILGIYAQQEWKVNEKLKVLGGLRADFHNAADEAVIFNPRLNILYNFKENLQWRNSYAKGFRAPQVFSEDIHARIAAGEVALVELADGLESETSHSFLTSLDWNKVTPNSEAGLTFEAFYTRLNDPFVLEQLSETIWEKRNGKGADVYGVNLEAKYAPGQKWQFQAGATIQKAMYDEAVQWSENLTNTNRNFFRSPNVYGNLMATFSPKKAFQNNISVVYTGKMYAQHYAGFIAEDRLETTGDFYEVNLKSSYTFVVKEKLHLQLSGGIQNLFNQYQKDFDLGVNRDATYIYGPSRPRTIFVGLKIGTDLL
ncbi:MAG TPA: TonB-dependent receptor [Flavobacterium sp.]|uniref:TonB-dependent receptor n=1 Tax=unclassified Flavobacterium TaxID=196869 RepID=UPI000E9FA212|nr:MULTISPECIES: TonB-dependent receptor [unclassified Flavobacterium]HBI00743.1 colicin I receptor [Flavobacterium sp.]HRE77703.1 TonB-dependent receptor [Flavobacterium sp.]